MLYQGIITIFNHLLKTTLFSTLSLRQLLNLNLLPALQRRLNVPLLRRTFGGILAHSPITPKRIIR